jgi:hypothetical protein
VLGYFETLLEYHLPGVNHRELTDEQFARKIAHLQYIRQEELNASLASKVPQILH